MTSRQSRRNIAISSRLKPHATRRKAALQNAHESIIAARVKTKVWLELSGEFFVGDGGIHLLGGIFQHGSSPRPCARSAGPTVMPGAISGGWSARSRRPSCGTEQGGERRAAWS